MQLLNDCETHKSFIQCGIKLESIMMMTGAGADLQVMLNDLGAACITNEVPSIANSSAFHYE